MSRITAELLRGARAGNSDALYDLAVAMKEQHQYKVSYIEIALEHLRVDRLPLVCAPPATNTCTDQFKIQVGTAIPAFGCIAIGAVACLPRPEVKRATTARLIEGFDGIVGWIDILMRHWSMLYKDWERKIPAVENLFRQICQLLSSLIQLDDRLAVAVFSSQKVLATAHQIWSLNLETHPARTVPMDKACPVLKLLAYFALHSSKEGIFHLLQALTERPLFLSSFCEGLVWRFRNTVVYHRQHKPDNDTVNRLFRLGAIPRYLFDETSNPTVFAQLRLSKVFPSWIATLFELREVLPAPHLRFHIHSAVLLATNRYACPAHSMSDMVIAGLVPLFLSTSSNLEFGERKAVLDALRTTQHLSRLALFPRTARALHSLLTPEHRLLSGFGRGVARGIIREVWQNLCRGMELTNRLLSLPPEDASEVTICDNRSHHQTATTSCQDSLEKSRCCSGCHLTVYCSERCQREDWSKRHRSECKSMEGTFVTRRHDVVHYSQANRQLHIRMLMTIFRSEYASMLNERDHSTSGKCILVVDASAGLFQPISIEEVKLIDFPAFYFGKFDSLEMEARKDEIINAFIAQPSSTTTRLLALVLFWDMHRKIHILVEAIRDQSEPDEAENYKVTQSVVRVEDARSSKFRYQSPFEANMIEVLKGQQGHVD
ncbi:hypothetical protein BKA70DRAFT_1568429 [Coprinopsis sp. MPI-PUGE-AT-0042]|nr:hypothetical protein BKA70DRAFT_1568429 [Coprinopsis sp. MPI-PUGE-AT-0042]